MLHGGLVPYEVGHNVRGLALWGTVPLHTVALAVMTIFLNCDIVQITLGGFVVIRNTRFRRIPKCGLRVRT